MKQTQLNLYWEINLGFSNVHLGFVDDSKFVSRQDPKIDSWPNCKGNSCNQVSPKEQDRTLFLAHIKQLCHGAWIITRTIILYLLFIYEKILELIITWINKQNWKEIEGTDQYSLQVEE